jgi:hypothetical protein
MHRWRLNASRNMGLSATVRQQKQAERPIVLPDRIHWLDQKALVAIRYVRHHGADNPEDDILG